MADVEIKGLELQIKAQTSQAVSALSALQSSLNSLKVNGNATKALQTLGTEINSFAQAAKGFDASSVSKIATLAEAMNLLSGIKKPNIPENLGSRIKLAAEAFKQLDSDNLTTKVKEFVDAVTPLSGLNIRIGNWGDNIYNFAEAMKKVDSSSLATKVNETATALAPLAKVLESIAKSTSVLPNNLSAGFVGLKATINDTSKSAQKFGGSLAGALKGGIAAARRLSSVFFIPFKGMQSVVGNVAGRMKKLFDTVKRLVFFRVIRSLIKQVSDAFKVGISNLYQYSKSVGTAFAPAMDRISTAMLYFKNSIGAAAGPLITTLAPAVDYVTDRIVDLINTFNQLMAKLTGKSQWTKALKYPAEYAEATEESTKAAKDYMLAFDELNVLNSSSGGSGGAAQDYSKMFEEQELDKSFATWVDDIKEAIGNGDWYGAGSILGEKIDEAIKSIDAEGLAYDLTDKVNDIIDFSLGFLDRLDTEWYGRGLADFLNDAIDNIETYDLGDLMGTKLQKVIDFAFGFAYEFNWEGAGLSINDFLEGYFEAIDGEKLGGTASGLYNGVLTTLKTVFTNMELSKDVSDDIAGFFNGIDWEDTIYNTLTTAGSLLHWTSTTFVDTIDKIEWSDVASAMARGFKKAVAEIPWDEIWDNINTLFNAAADFTFDMTQEWGFDIGKNISIALNNGYYDWHTGEWVDLTSQLYDEAGQYQAQTLDAILSGDITSVPGALFQDASHILDYFTGPSAFGFYNSDDANDYWLAQVGDTIQDMGDSFDIWTTHAGIGGTWNAQEGGLFTTDAIDDLLERLGLSGLPRDEWENIAEGILSGSLGAPSGVTLSTEDMALLQALLNKTDTTIKGGSRTVNNATKSWNGYKTALDNAKDSAKALTGETGTLDTAVTTMSEDIVSPLTNFKNTFNGAKDSASRAINDTKTNFVNGVNGMNTALVTPLSTLKSSVTGTFKDIKKDAVGAIKDTNTELTTPLDNVKNKIVTAFKNTNTELNTPITNIRKRGTNAINGTITDIETPLTNLKNKIVNSYKDTNTALNAPVSNIRKQAPDAIKNSTNDLTSPLSTFKDAMVNGFMAIPKMLKDQDFVGNATGLWRDVKKNIIDIGNSILTAGEIMANGMKDAFTNLSSTIGGYKLSLPKEFGGGTISFNFPKSNDITLNRIPPMAQGGLVTSPTTALIGEAGREAVMPLDNNTEWMDLLASRLVVGMSGSTIYDANDRPIQVHVTLDGREIYQNQEKVRRSIGYNVGGGAFA